MKAFNSSELEKLNEVNHNFNLVYKINKCGNPMFKGNDEKYTLRKTDNGKYLWSRYNYKCGYSHPLNMKRPEKIIHNTICGSYVYRPYDTSMSEFNAIEEAIVYFNNYLKKYRNEYVA